MPDAPLPVYLLFLLLAVPMQGGQQTKLGHGIGYSPTDLCPSGQVTNEVTEGLRKHISPSDPNFCADGISMDF